jgi:nicotinate-nucleotide pyrophosphorylase (carboxylating)
MTTERPFRLHPLQYEPVVKAALAEDLGRRGDITTDALVPSDQCNRGKIVCRESGVVAGLDAAALVFWLLDPETAVKPHAADGTAVATNQTVMSIDGTTRSILTGERTALNFLGRLSGVATLTHVFVDAVRGSSTRIVCTRKTTPGLRVLEKYAVRCGGGSNHRFGLDDAVLIKDNHLLAAGGVAPALARVRDELGHTIKVEIEVDTLDQLEEALAFGVDAVLLDNMTEDGLRRAVAMVAGRAVTEASGGVTLENVAGVAATGVDLISVGALTHSATSLDLSLELE